MHKRWQRCGPDQDYWDKLSPEHKVWLKEFNSRYYWDARFEPQQLTPEQYEKAGRDASQRNDQRGRSVDNCAPISRITKPSADIADKPSSPHSEGFDFKPRRGKPTHERANNRIPEEEI